MTIHMDLTKADLEAQIEALKAENAKLKNKAKDAGSTIKVSEKGAVSVYGLGRFPITLYKSQMIKLLDMADQIRDFIVANADRLKEKPKAD